MFCSFFLLTRTLALCWMLFFECFNFSNKNNAVSHLILISICSSSKISSQSVYLIFHQTHVLPCCLEGYYCLVLPHFLLPAVVHSLSGSFFKILCFFGHISSECKLQCFSSHTPHPLGPLFKSQLSGEDNLFLSVTFF